MRRALMIATLAAVVAGRPAAGQLRLTAAEAMARARVGHPDLARARADRLGREADARASLATYLPRVSTEWSVVRTDDPVAVFGSKLRQGTFGAPDLALDALNHPAPVSNASLGVTVDQPLIAPEGWYGRKAALAGAEAGRLALRRAEQLTAFDGLQAYFGAVLASARVAVLDTALAAARQMLAQVESLRREGVVTAVDGQLALARVSELEAGRLMAGAEALAATDRLLLAIGEDPGQAVELLDDLGTGAGPADSGRRFDLAARRSALEAVDANLGRVRAQRLPSVGAFGTLNYNDGSLGTLGGPRHWTAGFLVRWTPFRGFQDLAAADRARADREAARSELAAAERTAVSEVRAAAARLTAATAAVGAATRALEHSEEAARIAATRYAGGVATISELLAVRSAEAAQRAGRLEALYHARVARAFLGVAQGGDPR